MVRWRPSANRLVVAAGLFLLTCLPYVLGHALAPSGKVFNGFFFMADDAYSYLAKMKEGAEGLWGWADPYISRPVASPVPLFLFYLVWGKFCALFHLPLILGFHLARLSGAIALVFGVDALSKDVLGSSASRKLAMALVLTGGGIGFLAIALGGSGIGLEALDLHLPELSGFYSILAVPHFAWAAALMAVTARGAIAVAAGYPGQRKHVALTGGALLALCAIHPQMLVVWLGIMGMSLLLWKSPAINWWRAAAAFAPSVLPLAYYWQLLKGDEVVKVWASQWRHQAPGIASLLLALGLPFLFALITLAGVRKGLSKPLLLMGGWVALVLLMMYFPQPINIQRRLLDGIFIPVAILAAPCLAGLAKWGRRAVIASAVSSLVVLGIGVELAVTRPAFIYEDQAVIRAIEALPGRGAPSGRPAVLSMPETGAYIPVVSGDRVFVGHYSETLGFREKSEAARAAIAAPPETLAAFMERNGITLVLVGPRERRAGFQSQNDPRFRVTYEKGGVAVYELLPPQGPVP